MEKTQSRFTYVIFIIYSIFQCLSYINIGIIEHVVFGLFLVSVLFSNYSNIFVQKKYTFFGIFLFYYFFTSIIGANISIAFNRSIVMMELFSPILMFDIARKDKHFSMIPVIVLLGILIADVIGANAIIATVSEVGLRHTTSEANDEHDTIFKNVFSIIYVSSILVPFCLFLVKIYWSQKKKIICVGIAAIALFLGIFVMKALFMTAVLIMIGGVYMYVMSNQNHLFVKTTVLVLLILFGFLALFEPLLSIVGELENSIFYTQKLTEIYHSISGNLNEAEDASSRSDLVQSSFRTFIEFPLGCNYAIYDISDSKRLGVGGHSEWLDFLALYGIFSLLLFYFLWTAIKEQFFITKERITLILFCIIGFVNPVLFYMTNLFVFYLIPITIINAKRSFITDYNY